MKSEIILSVLLQLAPYHRDLPETVDQRASRLMAEADRIASVSASKPFGWEPATVAAVLISIGKHESNFAKYVHDGCEKIPDGAPNCDEGRAKSYYQLQARACPELHKGKTEVAARCAIRNFVSAFYRCREQNEAYAGAFSGYGRGAQCVWKPAVRRVATFHSIRNQIFKALKVSNERS